MNKKVILIGGGIVIIGLLWYLKSKKKNTKLPTRVSEDPQASAERQKIYDDIYIKVMSFDTSKGKPNLDTGVVKPMTQQEIYNLKTRISEDLDLNIYPKLDLLSIEEIKQYQTYFNGVIDSNNGDNTALDDILNDNIKFREYNKFFTNHPDLKFN